MNEQTEKNVTVTEGSKTQEFDVIVVGAGFGGMYMLHRLRGLKRKVRVIETGADVGGTWYWNRYPGARCDVESLEYQYAFSDEIQREWQWTERYATQPEILRYQQYVADKLDLRRDIQFNTRVTSAVYDDDAGRWTVETDRGDRFSARYCIMATGCLSAASVPDFEGLKDFEGETYHTGDWPHEGVDFTGKRVGVIGTGSSGIQSIPVIAEQAAHVAVFQRTPNYTIPAGNRTLTAEEIKKTKETLLEGRKFAMTTGNGILQSKPNPMSALEVTPEERNREFEHRWNMSGLAFYMSFNDLLSSDEANSYASDYARKRMRERIKSPANAELLIPKDYPAGTKRPCLDTNYLETFDRPNVELVNVKSAPIERITRKGVLTGGKEYEFDAIVFATGFDAMTGALLRIDIVGKDGLKLRDKWAAGPRTYLGLCSAGFPNMFYITGPGSPSVLCNMIVAIEEHVDWITDCITYLDAKGIKSIEPTHEAEDAWVDHVNEVANMTLMPKANTWYLGANIPGKARIFMPYVGGLATYDEKIKSVAAAGYDGFALEA